MIRLGQRASPLVAIYLLGLALLPAGCATGRPLAEPEPLDLGVTEIDLRRELRSGTRIVQTTTMSFEISGPATASLAPQQRSHRSAGTTILDITAISTDWVEVRATVDGVQAPMTVRSSRDGASVDIRLDSPTALDATVRTALSATQQQAAEMLRKLLVVTSQRWTVGESRPFTVNAPWGDGSTRRFEGRIALRGFARLGERLVAVFSNNGEMELRVSGSPVSVPYTSTTWTDLASGVALLTRGEAGLRKPQASVIVTTEERLDLSRSRLLVDRPR